MKRHDPQAIGDVIRVMLEESCLQEKMDEMQAAELWRHVVGESLACLTGKPEVKNGVMNVRISNASLRHELMMNRSRLREILNQKMGKEIITEIRFTT